MSGSLRCLLAILSLEKLRCSAKILKTPKILDQCEPAVILLLVFVVVVVMDETLSHPTVLEHGWLRGFDADKRPCLFHHPKSYKFLFMDNRKFKARCFLHFHDISLVWSLDVDHRESLNNVLRCWTGLHMVSI